MKYNAIDTCECINALGWGITLYTQGCHRHCPGCFNPTTWAFDTGTEFTNITIDNIIKLYDENRHFTHLVIEGGEPLEPFNWKMLNSLLANMKMRFPYIQIWLYTGYTYEELKDICAINSEAEQYLLPIITSLIDVMIDGPFIQEERDITLAFKGSKNQRIIDVKKTVEQKQIVLYNI